MSVEIKFDVIEILGLNEFEIIRAHQNKAW